MSNVAKKRKPAPQDRKPPPAELVDLPARLRTAMRSRGWDARGGPARLADASGLSNGQISAILSGERAKGITAAQVIRLARACQVSAGWLLANEGAMSGAAPRLVEGANDFDQLVDAVATRLGKR